MKPTKSDEIFYNKDWRDQIFQLLMRDVPSYEYNEAEEIGVHIMNMIAQIRFYSDELERFLLRKCDIGDISDFREYEEIVMTQLDQSDTYLQLKQQGVPNVSLNLKQFNQIKKVIDFIVIPPFSNSNCIHPKKGVRKGPQKWYRKIKGGQND